MAIACAILALLLSFGSVLAYPYSSRGLGAEVFREDVAAVSLIAAILAVICACLSLWIHLKLVSRNMLDMCVAVISCIVLAGMAIRVGWISTIASSI